ncbi:hypothetical protein BJV82DRAFT_630171 [Fennellomyces sp. T-0311]|nr:hypothetical protein BJV82DRAFT_630171 [Fennellomyces sp. T-0311]
MTRNGSLRPKPVDCMLIMLLVFNIFRLIDAVILITDKFPNNWAARGFLFEFSYAFGLGGFTLYLIGIAQTISQSHSVTGWLPSPFVVDVLGTIALLFPFFCTLPITIAGGARADTNLPEAETLVIAANATWFASAFTISCGILLAAIRLVQILKNHHKKTRRYRNRDEFKAGILKIQLFAAAFVICLWIYSTILMAFVARRRRIIDNTVGSVIMSVPWVLLGSLTTIAAQMLVIFNPKKMRNAALKSRSSETNNNISTNYSTTHPDQRFGGSTVDPMTTVFHDEGQNEAIMNVITKNAKLEYYGLPQTDSSDGVYINIGQGRSKQGSSCKK